MRFQIKKFQKCRGTEGYAFSFDLFVDGKKYAEVIEEGCGGCLLVHWEDSRYGGGPMEKAVDAYVAALPPIEVSEIYGENWRTEFPDLVAKYPDGKKQEETDMFLYSLVDQFENEKHLKRLCSKKTLFRKPNEEYKYGEYSTIAAPFSPAIKARIEAKYPGAVILNEQFPAKTKTYSATNATGQRVRVTIPEN